MFSEEHVIWGWAVPVTPPYCFGLVRKMRLPHLRNTAVERAVRRRRRERIFNPAAICRWMTLREKALQPVAPNNG
jgi:hypothetical protein